MRESLILGAGKGLHSPYCMRIGLSGSVVILPGCAGPAGARSCSWSAIVRLAAGIEYGLKVGLHQPDCWLPAILTIAATKSATRVSNAGCGNPDRSYGGVAASNREYMFSTASGRS